MIMNRTKNHLENVIGPITVGTLLRGYRKTHELSLDDMSHKLNLNKVDLQKIESSRHQLTLKEVVEITKKLDEPSHLYARVWCEEQAQKVGLDFNDIMNVV